MAIWFNYLTPEESAQVAVINYINLQYANCDILFTHPPQETYTKSRFQKWKNQVMGVKRGVPDILIFDPCPAGKYVGLAIEMKHGKNKPTPDQAKWLDKLAKRNWEVAVCYDSISAIETIDEYLKGVRNEQY